MILVVARLTSKLEEVQKLIIACSRVHVGLHLIQRVE